MEKSSLETSRRVTQSKMWLCKCEVEVVLIPQIQLIKNNTKFTLAKCAGVN